VPLEMEQKPIQSSLKYAISHSIRRVDGGPKCGW
jgi:hypothetical protein